MKSITTFTSKVDDLLQKPFYSHLLSTKPLGRCYGDFLIKHKHFHEGFGNLKKLIVGIWANNIEYKNKV